MLVICLRLRDKEKIFSTMCNYDHKNNDDDYPHHMIIMMMIMNSALSEVAGQREYG